MIDKLSLEARIKAEIYNFSGTVGLYANDFKGNIVELNSEEKFETASCVKVFILVEMYRQIHEGKIKVDDVLTYSKEHYVVGSGVLRELDFGVQMTAKNFAALMIIISDNIATNILIDLLGIHNINNTCYDLGLKNTILHNKLDFEKYDKLGTTTPMDYAKIFEMIYHKELWSQAVSEEMLEILRKQHYNTILTKGLPQYFLDFEDTGEEELIYIASKSGSMDNCRNDGGIIHTTYGEYVVSIFTKDFKDKLYHQDHESYIFGSRISRLLFDQYLSLKGFLK